MKSFNRARADAILLSPRLIGTRLFPGRDSAAGNMIPKSFRLIRIAAAVLLGVCFSLPTAAKGRQPMPALDGNYTSALAVANRFLQAWQAQNQEDGLLLLSDAAKQHVSEERIEAFFEHEPAAAYEIERGKTLKDGRYTFPVVLFGMVSSGNGRVRPHFSHIIVGRTGKGEWMVDRLP